MNQGLITIKKQLSLELIQHENCTYVAFAENEINSKYFSEKGKNLRGFPKPQKFILLKEINYWEDSQILP